MVENPARSKNMVQQPESVVHDPVQNDESPDPDKTERESTGKLLNRLILCIFAICLLWLTSLQVCVGIVGTNVAVPELSSVTGTCQFAYQQVALQRDYYAACSQQQISTCTRSLQAAHLSESLKTATQSNSNTHFVAAIKTQAQNCSQSYLDGKRAVSAWTGSGQLIPYQPTCSGAEKQDVAGLLGDTSESRASVLAASEEYSASSDTSVLRLAAYSSALTSYNAEYVRNKTAQLQLLSIQVVRGVGDVRVEAFDLRVAKIENTIQQLSACAGLEEGESECTYGASLRATYETLRRRMGKQLDAVEEEIAEVEAVVDAYAAQVNLAIIAANRFYDSVAGAQGLAAWVAANTGVSQLCGKSSPNWCSFSKADWFVYPPILPHIIDMPVQLDASALYAVIQTTQTAINAQLSNDFLALQSEFDLLLADMGAALAQADFTPNDYDPPGYPYGNHSEEERAQAERSSSFLADIQVILLSSPNISAQVVDIPPPQALNITPSTYVSSISEFSSNWAEFSAAGLNFGIFLRSIATLQGLLFLFDYIYRAVQTAKLFVRFWNKGVVNLPMADVRSKKPDRKGVWFKYISWLFNLLPFISLQLLLIFFLVLVIIWTIVVVLAPGYHSYTSACIHQTSNSTYLSRNLLSFAVNYASLDGNAATSAGVIEYNSQVQAHCASSFSQDSYFSLRSELLSHNNTLTSTRNDITQLHTCIAVACMDSLFQKACSAHPSYTSYTDNAYSNSAYSSYSLLTDTNSSCEGASAQQKNQCPTKDAFGREAYLPLGQYLSSPFCWAPLPTEGKTEGVSSSSSSSSSVPPISNSYGSLRYSPYDCAALPTCEITCSGPDRPLLSAVTKSCACMAEWYLNGWMLQTALAVGVFLLANISRMLITSGLVQVLWRYLTPPVFDYCANCDISGRPLSVVKSGKGAPSDLNPLSIKIRAVLHLYEIKGYVYIVLGLLLNIPWAVALYVIQANVQYAPH